VHIKIKTTTPNSIRFVATATWVLTNNDVISSFRTPLENENVATAQKGTHNARRTTA